MKKKKQKKAGVGRPPLHIYTSMEVGEVNVREFKTVAERLNARCAAHMVGYRHKKKFDTVDSVSKAGKFMITVKRVK